jgi:type II secretory pathway pseudopilin PulG
MISVAIIGILASAAIPAFRMYQFRSKRSEAYATLESIRKAQLSYKAEYDNFVSAPVSPGMGLNPDKQNWHSRGSFSSVPGTGFDQLGWKPEGPTYFDYDTEIADLGGGPVFTAAAYGDVDGDGFVSAFLYAHEDSQSPPNVVDCSMCGVLFPWSGPPTDEGGDEKYRMVTRLPASAADDF